MQMRISVPGISTPDEVKSPVKLRGFTILEILVVIAVISVIASTILLNTNFKRPDTELKQHATRLGKTLKLLMQESILNDQNYALSLVPGGYRVLKFDGQAFTPSNDRFFTSLQKQHNYHDELVVENRIIAASEPKEPSPHIFILSSGEMSVFQWDIQDRDNQLEVRLLSSMTGDITVEGPSEIAL